MKEKPEVKGMKKRIRHLLKGSLGQVGEIKALKAMQKRNARAAEREWSAVSSSNKTARQAWRKTDGS